MKQIKLAFSTDIFTVSSLFFPGGDIGKLFICDTCNDLSIMEAKPKYLTCNITGIGEILKKGISSNSIIKDDVIIISRDIGCHRSTIFASYECIELASDLKSDCLSLFRFC